MSLPSVTEVFARNRRERIPQWKMAGSRKIIWKGGQSEKNDENLQRPWVRMFMVWVYIVCSSCCLPLRLLVKAGLLKAISITTNTQG